MDPKAKRAFADLIAQHHDALRDIAVRTLRAQQETAGFGAMAIAPTSLVADTVLRLMDQRELPTKPAHLRGLASIFMTRVIADRRRARLASKRDARVTARLDTQMDPPAPDAVRRLPTADVRHLEDAMVRIAARHPRQMQAVTLHLVAGIPLERVAELLAVSPATAQRDVEAGKTRLARELRGLRTD